MKLILTKRYNRKTQTSLLNRFIETIIISRKVCERLSVDTKKDYLGNGHLNETKLVCGKPEK